MKTTKNWSKMLMLGMFSLVLTFGLVAAGCKDKSDPGSGSGSSSSGGKPAKLASGATYQQAVDKCDAIITYCNSHSGATNDTAKLGAQSMKTSITTAGSSGWSSIASSAVTAINGYIDILQ